MGAGGMNNRRALGALGAQIARNSASAKQARNRALRTNRQGNQLSRVTVPATQAQLERVSEGKLRLLAEVIALQKQMEQVRAQLRLKERQLRAAKAMEDRMKRVWLGQLRQAVCRRGTGQAAGWCWTACAKEAMRTAQGSCTAANNDARLSSSRRRG